MKIALGADHAAFVKKIDVAATLEGLGHTVIDFGTFSEASVDYPDYAKKVARAVAHKKSDLGVLLCGSGQGMCMAANRVKGIRAVLPWSPRIARLTRQHNNANVLCLSGRFMTKDQIRAILKAWLATPFSNEPRHKRRIRKLEDL